MKWKQFFEVMFWFASLLFLLGVVGPFFVSYPETWVVIAGVVLLVVTIPVIAARIYQLIDNVLNEKSSNHKNDNGV
jgi:diacylglycerol kinase